MAKNRRSWHCCGKGYGEKDTKHAFFQTAHHRQSCPKPAKTARDGRARVSRKKNSASCRAAHLCYTKRSKIPCPDGAGSASCRDWRGDNSGCDCLGILYNRCWDILLVRLLRLMESKEHSVPFLRERVELLIFQGNRII